ncbi:Crp/Fnr family transcriptional regulator [Solirhodobacter olei]|uniref:Crp/Fnr family transcriptional regulator n=1 Tax=Solirhodobacter olei TaxID=2493082 RepID=UPI0013E3DE8A|nr:Crp/Fnr family transcriptional regulator [Solirhodobacter olei]
MLPQTIETRPSGCLSCQAYTKGICGGLPARAHARLKARSYAVGYHENQGLWNETSDKAFVGILQSGYLRMARYSAEGRRQIMGLVFPGELVDERADVRMGYELEAVTPAQVCRIERPAFERLISEEPELRRAVYLQHAVRLDEMRQLVWSLGLQTSDERLVRFLALACEKLRYQPMPDGGGILTVDIPRADIADLLGTTRESISRITHRLQDEGLIEIRDPMHFGIPDLDRLRRSAGLVPARAANANRRTTGHVQGLGIAPDDLAMKPPGTGGRTPAPPSVVA